MCESFPKITHSWEGMTSIDTQTSEAPAFGADDNVASKIFGDILKVFIDDDGPFAILESEKVAEDEHMDIEHEVTVSHPFFEYRPIFVSVYLVNKNLCP